MGNHEGSGALFKKYFPFPFYSADRYYWSFDYGPAHFAVVDQYTSYGTGSDQYQWLENDLATSDKTWKFIVLHEPGWSAAGEHQYRWNGTDDRGGPVSSGIYIAFLSSKNETSSQKIVFLK